MTAALGLLVAWYLAVGLGVSVGYHRVLTHRAARVSKPVLYALVLAGLAAGPPAEWVGNHRRHHRYADTKDDAHSPLWLGFWYAHCGWYLGIRSRLLCVLYACGGPVRLLVDALLRPVAPGGNAKHARDVLSDPFLGWLSRRPGYAIASSVQLAPFALAIAGLAPRGWSAPTSKAINGEAATAALTRYGQLERIEVDTLRLLHGRDGRIDNLSRVADGVL